MGEIRDYKDLIVWQKSMALVTEVYRVSRLFGKEELFGLTSQIRRAAVSIPSNIAEGNGRTTRDDYVRFLTIAAGSANEVETQALISVQLGYTKEPDVEDLLGLVKDVQRLLRALIKSLAGSKTRRVQFDQAKSGPRT